MRIFGSCAKCLRFATAHRTMRRGSRSCALCLRFATAHRTTAVYPKFSFIPIAIGLGKLRIYRDALGEIEFRP